MGFKGMSSAARDDLAEYMIAQNRLKKNQKEDSKIDNIIIEDNLTSMTVCEDDIL